MRMKLRIHVGVPVTEPGHFLLNYVKWILFVLLIVDGSCWGLMPLAIWTWNYEFLKGAKCGGKPLK